MKTKTDNTNSREIRAMMKLEKAIWATGGHWASIKHENGHIYYVQRKGLTSYEGLSQDDFRVKDENGVVVLNTKNLRGVCDFLLNVGTSLR